MLSLVFALLIDGGAGACPLLASDPPPLKEYPSAPDEFRGSGSENKCPLDYVEERAPVFGATAIGALAGGVIGSAAAIGIGGTVDEDAAILSLIALPPMFVAAGAGVGAWSTGGSNAAWGGTGAALLGAGASALVTGLLLYDSDDKLVGNHDVTFLLQLAAAPVVGALAGATTAALLAEPL